MGIYVYTARSGTRTIKLSDGTEATAVSFRYTSRLTDWDQGKIDRALDRTASAFPHGLPEYVVADGEVYRGDALFNDTDGPILYDCDDWAGFVGWLRPRGRRVETNRFDVERYTRKPSGCRVIHGDKTVWSHEAAVRWAAEHRLDGQSVEVIKQHVDSAGVLHRTDCSPGRLTVRVDGDRIVFAGHCTFSIDCTESVSSGERIAAHARNAAEDHNVDVATFLADCTAALRSAGRTQELTI